MSKCREVSSKRVVGDPAGGPLPKLGVGHGMAEPLCLRGSAMADPHGRAPLLGGSGVGQASSVRSFERVFLVFGAFLEAPKSYERDSRTVAKLSSIRTQRSLFCWIQRTFDPPNTSKHRRVSPKRPVEDPEWGPLPITGARPWDVRAPASAGLGHGQPTWPCSPVGGLGGRPGVVGSLFCSDFLGFRGFSRSTEVV